MQQDGNGWRNRIVGHGEEAPDQLLANPMNWRVHPIRQQQAMSGVLDEIGWIDEVIVNRRTGHVINGHMRVAISISRGEPSVPVKYVDLDEAEEALALATYDPLAAMAVTDQEQLAALLERANTDDAALLALLDQLAQGEAGEPETDATYSTVITSPVYEPTGLRPKPDELYDESATRAITEQIEAAVGLTEAERRFLMAAAQRHTVFHFGRIAEFYAHADEQVQTLMEESALVIIDMDRAIELGYVRLGERIAELYGIDFPHA